MADCEIKSASEEIIRVWTSIFSSCPVEEGPMVNSDWEIVLVPHQLIMQEGEFRCLEVAAAPFGDKSCVVLSEDLQLSVTINWDYKYLLGLAGHAIAVDNAYLCGRSGSWGMVCTHDDYSVLGGESAFISTYASASGGRGHLRENFLDWISSPGWFVSTHVTQKLLALAGWSQ